MQKFYHNEQKKIIEATIRLNNAFQKFNSRDFDSGAAITTAIKYTIEMYKSLGLGIKESAAHAMLAEYTTAQKGINTITFQKQQTGKNELLYSTGLKVLQELQIQLQTCHQENAVKINAAKELIAQIVTAALQLQLITPTILKATKTQTQAEKLWAKIAEDANIALGQQRALLIVSKYDCMILFIEMVDALK